MSLAIGDRLGPYEILAPIGSGGMGEVYKSRDIRLERIVAVKVSKEQFSERFTREARSIAALNHPNICHLYDVGPNYLVMEYVEGETLQGPIPFDEAMPVIQQLIDGIEAAHERNVVHRDLKPANIKITPDGVVKILDFGLARAVDPVPEGSAENSPTLTMNATQAGTILGTAAYMSPEQAKGKTADRRSDIWSFGVIVYELLAGKRLFQGESVVETLGAVLNHEPNLNAIPKRMQKLLRWCLEKNRKERLQAIGDARRLLAEESGSTPVTVGATSRRIWAGSVLAAALAFALGTLVQFRSRVTSPERRVEFQIPIPETMILSPGDTFALSPDGQRLAFTGTGPNGVRQLWVRDLASAAIRPLPGSQMDANGDIFWSSDSRYVVFRANAKLKKIDIRGGPPQTLGDATNTLLGGFSTGNGDFVFGILGQGILRMAETGGPVKQVTREDTSRRETYHALPVKLPDGRHFLYLRVSSVAENTGIYIGSLDLEPTKQDNKQLVATAFGVQYVPNTGSGPGHILFVREGTLMDQRFDSAKRELQGDPVNVVEAVSTFFSDANVRIAPNGTLVYRTSASQKNQPEWFDRQGKSQGSVGKADMHIAPFSISPDGNRAILAHLDSQSNEDLWLLDLVRGTSTRFAFGSFRLSNPVWTADGRRIIFQNEQGSSKDLYEKDLIASEEPKLLLKSTDMKTPTSISHDGHYLLFTGPRPPRRLWALPLVDSQQPFQITRTNGDEQRGQFSPDTKWIAYQSNESGREEVYVRAFSTPQNGSTTSGEKWLVSRGGGTWPRWRGDGKELFYQSPENRLMAVSTSVGTSFQSGEPESLFTLPKLSYGWEPTPDGKRFLVLVGEAETAQAPFTVVLNWHAGLPK